MPGDNTEMSVELIAPIAMDQGLRFAIREGGRTVGAGRVTNHPQITHLPCEAERGRRASFLVRFLNSRPDASALFTPSTQGVRQP